MRKIKLNTLETGVGTWDVVARSFKDEADNGVPVEIINHKGRGFDYKEHGIGWALATLDAYKIDRNDVEIN